MTSTRRFRTSDLFKFNSVNLDPLTETYNIQFYLSYLIRWPNLFLAVQRPSQDGHVCAYIMGKTEGRGEDWHGHVTALSVSPPVRRMGIARKLMNRLEEVCEGR